MKKIIVLGGGRIGRVIALNLSEDHVVCLTDLQKPDALPDGIEFKQLDVTDKAALQKMVADYDLVVGALPSVLGFKALKAVLETGQSMVDISFFTKDPLQLDDFAKKHNATAIVDMGLAPGLTNLFAGHFVATYEQVDELTCLVGGLPVERNLPFEYKAPFAPLDVIEEYTRPARMKRNGQDLVLPPLTEIETLHVPGIGDLEAFNTDGLRTLLTTVDIPTMAEKTIRYPGHAQFITQLKQAGFFNDAHRENTAEVLQKQWQFQAGEQDLTVLEIRVKGIRVGQQTSEIYRMVDHYDTENYISSMARTTGYTCAATARLMLNNKVMPGVLAPEHLGQDVHHFEYLLANLAQHNIKIKPCT
ncbi:saccharopine dehydrogenase family protein [Marinicella gelatinilytica]|uniref:saccharopine dehydrogenase family protein n=1 Tax=Marinicella gelatinilytica TaxID=2996017 RepID=UPI002260B379|nr:saccharopine dehydrogenase C-terminal domain-containing protein [Marinicella gelatinilytica]MCX7545293.1 saccharopine dehydrogenase NADP-binding domain-containing protein [Marinicella gelatinilytica]